MVRACLPTVRRWDDFERELLAAQQAHLALAYQIDGLGTKARDGTRSDQSPPNVAPSRLGNADRLHRLGSNTGPREQCTSEMYQSKAAGKRPLRLQCLRLIVGAVGATAAGCSMPTLSQTRSKYRLPRRHHALTIPRNRLVYV